MISQYSTGILFFARTPEAEAKAKSWTPSYRKNLRLAQELHHKALNTMKASGMPIVVVDNCRQEGNTFNEKISNAIDDFFKSGYENAIVLGSDCPELTLDDILKSSKNLESEIQTVGKSFDGGVYLFTISKKDFELDNFQELPWCSSLLGDALVERLRLSNLEVEFLSSKLDLDQNLSLTSKWLRGISLKLRLVIFSLIYFIPLLTVLVSWYKTNAFFNPNHRGPPYIG